MFITIGVVTYNRPELLREAVDSVLSQSFQDFNMIISNDYTPVPVTFDTLGINDDPRVTIINQPVNLGEVKNHNYLLSVANSEYFIWLADDDLLHPEYLQIAYDSIKNCQENNVVAFYAGYTGGPSPEYIFPKNEVVSVTEKYSTGRFITDYTSKKISLVGVYGIMNTEALRIIGGLPRLGNSFGPYSDNIIPILLSHYGKILYVKESLVFLRTHPESLSCCSEEFSAYTSAEEDFMRIFNQVCLGFIPEINRNQVFSNMVKWFSLDELEVLSRSQKYGTYDIIIKYLQYQLQINVPRLTGKYKLYHILYIARLLFAKYVYYKTKAILGKKYGLFGIVGAPPKKQS